MTPLHTDNRRLGWKLAIIALAMSGFGYVFAPAYQSYCRMTGLNGSTGQIDYNVALSHTSNTQRWITVEFVTDTAGTLPWEFRSDLRSLKVHPGELVRVGFHARNLGNFRSVAQAVPSVTPGAAAPYFYNVDGLCAAPQELARGEDRDMPMLFLVAADLPPEISTVTLGIAFFEVQGAPVTAASSRVVRRI